MKSIKQLYLVPTKYGKGINLLAETNNGEWYQQIHVSLDNSGGGAAEWVKLGLDEIDQPILLNPRT